MIKKNINNIKNEISNQLNDNFFYPNYDDTDFQDKIYKKREFYYHKIPHRELLTDYKDIKKFRDDKCGGSFKLRTQQYMLSNFINPDTPFKGLLLFHGVGTGKTCAAITVAETFKEQVKKYNTKIYILVSGPLMKENWKDEIIKCTNEVYFKDINTVTGFLNQKETQKNIKLAKYLSQQYYKIISYKSFYKKVLGQKIIDRKFDKDKVKKIYQKNKEGEFERDISFDKIDSLNNTLLIIDEAHNLINNEYGNTILKIIKNSKNLKILLLTATPMINFADEIIELLNYLRPINDPIIYDLVFTNDKSFNMKFTNNGEEYLKKMANGYVSHFRGANPLTYAEAVEIGEIPDGLYFNKLFRCRMLEFQLNTYNDIIENYQDSLDRKSQAVSNFCFPGLNNEKNDLKGFSGKSGMQNILNQLKLNKKILQKLINEKFFDNKLDETEIIKENNSNKLITGLILKKENIKFFSIKFYNCLNNILDLVEGKKGAGTAFLYFNLVKIGIELFSEVLIMNGFLEYNENRNYTINNDTLDAITGYTYEEFINKKLPLNEFYPATFLTVTGQEDINQEKTPELKKKLLDQVFNKIENKNGKYIKFILGSKVMNEGITLENISEIHILDVYYNLSRLHQVIGRGLRECKHYKITNELNPFPKVNIYKYVVSLNENSKLTTEEQMYQKAELKYILIKKTERLLKEVAFDCPINYHGNIFPEEIEKYKDCMNIEKYTSLSKKERDKAQLCPANCDFIQCNFKCFDKKLNLNYYDKTNNLYKNLTKLELDYSTFNTKLARNEINSIKETIKNLYKFSYVYILNDIIKIIKNTYSKDKLELFDDFFVFKALDELIPLSENDFNNFSDIIYDKFNIPGYLIYRNNFYIFQPFNQNENVPMYYRTTFSSRLFNDLSIFEYLKSIDILKLINNTIDINIIDSKQEKYNFRDVIDYYYDKEEFKYVGIIDRTSVKNRNVFFDIFKLRYKRKKIFIKKREEGIASYKGAHCNTAFDKNKLLKIALDLDINNNNESKDKLCSLIEEKLHFLEKYSTKKDNNKFTYLIIPYNHPKLKFPINLEDQIEDLISSIKKEIPIKFSYNINKSNNGIFLSNRDKKYIKYIIEIENDKDINSYTDILEKYNFKLVNNKWIIIIE